MHAPPCRCPRGVERGRTRARREDEDSDKKDKDPDKKDTENNDGPCGFLGVLCGYRVDDDGQLRALYRLPGHLAAASAAAPGKGKKDADFAADKAGLADLQVIAGSWVDERGSIYKVSLDPGARTCTVQTTRTTGDVIVSRNFLILNSSGDVTWPANKRFTYILVRGSPCSHEVSWVRSDGGSGFKWRRSMY